MRERFGGDGLDLIVVLRLVGDLDVPGLLGGLFGELDDRLDHRLEVPVAEHDGPEHLVFGKLLGFRFHHHHGVVGAGDDEVERRFAHLVDHRVQHVLAVDEADAGGADRAEEGQAGKRQRGGGRDHADDVGIVFKVVREHGDDDLHFVLEAFDEQRDGSDGRSGARPASPSRSDGLRA